MGRRRIVTLAAFLAFGAEAEFPASASQDSPTFRSRVQSIEVDVQVTDRRGNVVRDLTKDDFILLDDGVPQAISTATLIDLGTESRVTRQLPGDIESDIVNNAGRGRMWVMLVGPFRDSRRIARRFVESSLGPNDEMAILSLFGAVGSAQPFTRSRQRMFAAIDRQEFDPPPPTMNVALLAFDTLGQVCDRLSRVGGRRKAVIIIDPPAIWIPDGPLSAAFLAQRDALRCATRNNVAVNVVSSMGLTPEFGNLTTMSALHALADETGGRAIVNSNDFEGGYQRFVSDTSVYYLLGYTPSVEHRDGKFHPITVRVNRPGLTVLARRGYYALPPETESKPAASPEQGVPGLSPDTREALRLPFSMNGLTIDLAATPFRGTGGNGLALITARVRGPDLAFGAGELVEVAYQAMTIDGQTTPGTFNVFKLDLSDQSRASAGAIGLRFDEWLALPPGRHQIRFVAHQPNGRTGMVVADVELPDFSKAPVSLSGVVLASERLPAQLAMKTDEVLRQLLRGHPTAERSFAGTDVVTAYVEGYTDEKTSLERVTASIAPADQLKRTQAVETIVAVREPHKTGHVAQLPLRDLRPGDYVLTFEARAGRRSATRRLLFTVADR